MFNDLQKTPFFSFLFNMKYLMSLDIINCITTGTYKPVDN